MRPHVMQEADGGRVQVIRTIESGWRPSGRTGQEAQREHEGHQRGASRRSRAPPSPDTMIQGVEVEVSGLSCGVGHVAGRSARSLTG